MAIWNNRWVVPAGKIPWGILVNTYQQQLNNGRMGADGINPRVAIGAMILKHLCKIPGLSHAQDNKPLSLTDKSDENGNDPPKIDPVCDETAPADEIALQGHLIVNILPLICFLILISLVSFSQDSVVIVQKGQILKYRKGYIVTAAGDTVQGLIYHKSDSGIYFIRGDKKIRLQVMGNFSEIPRFTADEGKIKAFYRNGISYCIRSIPPDGRKVFLALVEDGRIALYGLIRNYEDKRHADLQTNTGFIGFVLNQYAGDEGKDEEYYSVKYYLQKKPDDKLIDIPIREKKFQEVFFPLVRDNPAFIKALRDQPADFYHLRGLVRQYNVSYGKK